MREQLGDRGFRDLGVQIPDILADRIVKPQLVPLAQLHDACGGERLGVRRDPKAMAGRELFAAAEIGKAEGALGHDPAAMGDRDDAAWLLGGSELELEPVADVVACELQPRVHASTNIGGMIEIGLRECY